MPSIFSISSTEGEEDKGLSIEMAEEGDAAGFDEDEAGLL
jgi:hypothetical protein